MAETSKREMFLLLLQSSIVVGATRKVEDERELETPVYF